MTRYFAEGLYGRPNSYEHRSPRFKLVLFSLVIAPVIVCNILGHTTARSKRVITAFLSKTYWTQRRATLMEIVQFGHARL